MSWIVGPSHEDVHFVLLCLSQRRVSWTIRKVEKRAVVEAARQVPVCGLQGLIKGHKTGLPPPVGTNWGLPPVNQMPLSKA